MFASRRFQTAASILILAIFIDLTSASVGNRWTYQGDLGPAHWATDYKDCGGQKQSPINIVTSEVKLDSNLGSFNLDQLSKTENVGMTLENVAGHTVEVHLTGDEIQVSGGGLESPYGVSQFHFHWGSKDERGSEHTINDKHFPMEMHIVMYSRKYPDIQTAMEKERGLAVLGFLFEVGEKNDKFDPLLEHFDKIEHSGDIFNLSTTFPIESLLPDSPDVYYRYEGSLTTPPCYETVVWTIFTNTITVSEEQLEKFRHIKRNRDNEKDEFLVDDFRPVQSLGNREVTTNDEEAIYNTASSKTFPGFLLLLCLPWVFLRL